MYVMNPDPYLLPAYRISPFRTSDISFNCNLSDSTYADEYFSRRFKANKYQYTINGREALNLALRCYSLQRNDVVTVLTTTGNFYVSSCVTSEINKFCQWSRKIEENSKVILVIHEFGYPFPDVLELRNHSIPIIEDCAHCFFLSETFHEIGTISDFSIYSFPKMFPMQIGGLLVSNIDHEPLLSSLGETEKSYIKNILSYYILRKEEIIEKRLINYSYFSRKFKEFGIEERFLLTDGIIPGVFMFRKGSIQINLAELKKHFYAHGIQCSVFYGEESFFIPVHQNLNAFDCRYIEEVLYNFIWNKL